MKMVKVRALTRMYEDGAIYNPGVIFETTLERAEGLGDSVEILEAPEPEVKAKKKAAKDKMVKESKSEKAVTGVDGSEVVEE